ncbi:MAG TPA: Fur family transcriptional regulator [Xanthobacteraceae bacterium]|jgi:Fur family transcriptional regulator, zinc uptake regulator|nr:Fur family transcriptional regulator [Xanthobacteraceae bacterium]HUO00422.1 Fur family transcriptional regulator [Bradyrhizobium sp.]
MTMSRQLVANHRQVLQALQSAKGPMTAYEVLNAVRRSGITAPPTVYRALTRLIEEGLAHRLESINAYVACAEPEHRHGPAVFAICRDCGHVDELEEGVLIRRLQKKATQQGFVVDSATIELKGRCSSCAES